jgi:formate hydrogenlyase subunit 3/multisubunit Na+/H+ antiporter MnhD subunit
MNAPLIFLLSPIGMAVPAYFIFPTRSRGILVTCSLFCLVLSIFAFFLPIDQPLSLLGFYIPISHSLQLWGRNLVFDSTMRPFLALLFFTVAAFFMGAVVVKVGRLFLPVGLSVLSLYSGALFIQPFLYASFFLFFAACLFSFLIYSGSPQRFRAPTRFLVFSLLGIPFLLLSGSLLSPTSSSALDDSTLRLCLSLWAIGFAILLTIPPMHFWQLDAVDDANPYALFFLLSLHQTAILVFLLRFFNEFAWLRLSPIPYQGLQWAGVFLCVIGAIFSLLQNRLGRLIIYISMIQFGCLLLSLSAKSSEGLSVFFALLFIRIFIFLLCGISFFQLKDFYSDDRVNTVRGFFYRLPVASISLFLSLLSLACFPGLLSFPAVWATLRLLSLQSIPANPAVWILLAAIGLGSLSVFYQARYFFQSTTNASDSRSENRFFQFFLIILLFTFLLASVFPQLYFPWVSESTASFSTIWKN